MSVLSVDLACRSWSDLGVVLLEQKDTLIHCDVIPWQGRETPPVVELAIRLNALCVERYADVLMLDGPQAWKAENNGYEYCRASERELNTAAKTGLPGTVLPVTYERFVVYCLALYDALERLGWQRLATRKRLEDSQPRRILVESYPYAAWKSLGISPLPSKRRCRPSHLSEAWASLTSILPVAVSQPPNHDQLQAIIGGLPGLALEQERSHFSTRIVGQPPRQEGGYWREGFIAIPLPPSKEVENPRLQWID